MMRSRYPDGGHFQGKNFVFDRCVTRCCVGSCGPRSLAFSLRVRVEIMGSANLWNRREISVSIVIDPIIFTRTRN
jgi:hypothetical protein